MILKNHSCSFENKNFYIYQYDKQDDEIRKINIKDICKKNYLYEFKNEDNQIIPNTQNLIENLFSIYENKWARVIRKIKDDKPLSDEDLCYLYLLIAYQYLRVPKSIDFLTKKIEENTKLSKAASDACAKLSCFLLANHPECKSVLASFINHIFPMHIGILKSTKIPFFLNGECAVNSISFANGYNLNDSFSFEFLLPIDKHYCLVLTKEKPKNTIMDISKFSKGVEQINKCIFNYPARFIYCSEKFKNKEAYADDRIRYMGKV